MEYTKDNPFLAKLTERIVLNKAGSKKCTMHLTLDISGSGIDFKVGDSIAIQPENDNIIVKETFSSIGASGSEIIKDPRSENKYPFAVFLKEKANISRVTKKWVYFILDHLQDPKEKHSLEKLLEPTSKEELKTFCEDHQLWDLCRQFKSLKIDPQSFCNMLSPLLPRFYSIASSPKVKRNEIDLLIIYFTYMTSNHLRYGVASHYLCHEAPLHLPAIPMYLHPSKGFTIPPQPHIPIIMVGPGTGVAPFRGFLQQRLVTNAPGKNWLFFGEWNREYDFFYEDFFKKAENEGKLKLSLAFSRDQKEKAYVQHKMLEEASLLWEWLEEGAVFFVCGDAVNMAKDVDQTLHLIIQEQGKKTPEDAKLYIKDMKTNNKYLRDVY